MRRLTVLVLIVTLVMAPITSMIATAMGFSGEHVHYDHTWHTASEWAQAKAAARNAHHHAHDDTDHHDHDRNLVVLDDSDAHHDDDGGAPLKHSHADQVHAAPFVTVSMPQMLLPDFIAAVASAPASFPVQQHPYPPFRPPQHVLSA
jgi:hypothetical protein